MLHAVSAWQRISLLAVLVTSVTISPAAATPVLNTTDFISAPTHFNGFEAIPNDGTFYTGGGGPYTEDTIIVEQINGDPSDIWVTLGQAACCTMEGRYSWYPNAGDHGYTRITLAAGADFASLSLILRPYDVGNVLYDLLDGGSSVLSGFLSIPNSQLSRIGFEGGGFDEVLLRTGSLGESIFDGGQQALQIDSIKVGEELAAVVPEPATIMLFGTGLLGLGAFRRHRKARA